MEILKDILLKNTFCTDEEIDFKLKYLEHKLRNKDIVYNYLMPLNVITYDNQSFYDLLKEIKKQLTVAKFNKIQYGVYMFNLAGIQCSLMLETLLLHI